MAKHRAPYGISRAHWRTDCWEMEAHSDKEISDVAYEERNNLLSRSCTCRLLGRSQLSINYFIAEMWLEIYIIYTHYIHHPRWIPKIYPCINFIAPCLADLSVTISSFYLSLLIKFYMTKAAMDLYVQSQLNSRSSGMCLLLLDLSSKKKNRSKINTELFTFIAYHLTPLQRSEQWKCISLRVWVWNLLRFT